MREHGNLSGKEQQFDTRIEKHKSKSNGFKQIRCKNATKYPDLIMHLVNDSWEERRQGGLSKLYGAEKHSCTKAVASFRAVDHQKTHMASG
jgi:hypothetical protein